MEHDDGQRSGPKGVLMMVGGAERPAEDDELAEQQANSLLDDFVRLCTVDGDARILVSGLASEDPDEIEADYVARFTGLGATVRRLNPSLGEEHLDWAHGLWLTGGDQQRLCKCLRGLVRSIVERHADGLTVGGTSAGASALSTTMITGGEESMVHESDVSVSTGLGLIDAIVDQHFVQRGRIDRLVAALQVQRDTTVGIGIDEATAVVEFHGRLIVRGLGSVVVLDSSHAGFPAHGDRIAVEHSDLNLLTADNGYDLGARRVLTDGEAHDLLDDLGLPHGTPA